MWDFSNLDQGRREFYFYQSISRFVTWAPAWRPPSRTAFRGRNQTPLHLAQEAQVPHSRFPSTSAALNLPPPPPKDGTYFGAAHVGSLRPPLSAAASLESPFPPPSFIANNRPGVYILFEMGF